MIRKYIAHAMVVFMLFGQTPAYAGFSLKKAFKKVKREAKKAVKKIVHKPTKLMTEITIAPTVGVISLIKDPKKTIKNPTETIGHNTSETTDVGSRILNDILDTGLDGVGKVGESIEDAAEPLADIVTVGGGVNVDSNGNTNLTDGEGNIVDRKPTDPSDMTSDSFDWESAIAFSRKNEVDDFIAAEKYLENSEYFKDLKIEKINEINENLLSMANTIGNSSVLNKETHIKEILKAREALINFSKGEGSAIDLNMALNKLKDYMEKEELRGPANALVWGGLVAASIPVIQFGYNVKRYNEVSNRIADLKDFIVNSGTENRKKYNALFVKLEKLDLKIMVNLVFSGGETLGKIYTFSLTGRASIITNNAAKIKDIGLNNLKDLVEEMNKNEAKEELEQLIREL